MATRANACSELTRFWIEARHSCLVTESVPVPVPYGLSDLDLVAIQPAMRPLVLPDGRSVGPRLAIETKDEHDFDPTGKEFGKALRSDAALLGNAPFIPRATTGPIKFSMLREAHFEVASALLGTQDFDRLFVVHAVDPLVLKELEPALTPRKIYWLTIADIVRDLRDWYRVHSRQAGLRHTLVGDLWHLLVGYCGLDLPST